MKISISSAQNLLVLLDLIGTHNVRFVNLFEKTVNWYIRRAEIDLRKNGLWTGEDDYILFMKSCVRVVHLIGVPFPSVWHQFNNTKEALDFDAIQNLNKIMRTFVTAYLHLNIQ